jgi:cytochrome c oxidase subunit II
MTPTRKILALGLITGLGLWTAPVRARAQAAPQVITISASKFQFTPNHITLVKGQPVTLQLTSSDRVHGFMIRPLKIDTDVKPGKVTAITVTPQTAGTFKAICDHYCGLGHGGMKMTVVVEESTAEASPAKVASASSAVSK